MRVPPLLVADRDSASIDAAVRAAWRLGLPVVSCASGIETLERFHAVLPVAVLVDHMLPALDGMQVALRLRGTPGGQVTPLLLTGVLAADQAARLREEYRFTDVLAKPFDADLVVRMLEPFLVGEERPAEPLDPPPPAAAMRPAAVEPPAKLLVDIAARRLTGELVWSSGPATRTLAFREGGLVAGRSNLGADTVASWVARDPMLAPEERRRAAATLAAPPGRAVIGPDEVQAGAGLTRAQLEASRERWLVHLLLAVAASASGSVGFAAGPCPAGLARPIDIAALLPRILRHAPAAPFAAELPPLLTPLRRPSSPAAEDLGLSHLEHELLGLIDGQRSTGEVLSLARLVGHDVRPFLHGLLALGLVEPRHRAAPTPDPGTGAASDPAPEVDDGGSLRDVHLAQVLGRLHREARTGILVARHGNVRHVFHFDAGQLVFARSSERTHRLGRVLLRSRLVSAEDHSRAKRHRTRGAVRLGAMLFEMGALSLRELNAGLCAQLRSVLRDAMHLAEGTYAFVAGGLPTTDTVSLGASTPQTILECLRGVAIDAAAAARYLPAPASHLQRGAACDQFPAAALSDTEVEVLRAAERGLSVGEIALAMAAHADEAASALLALLAVGAVETADADDPAQTEPPATVPAELARRLRQLEAERQRLEAENRRLRERLEVLECGDRQDLVGR